MVCALGMASRLRVPRALSPGDSVTPSEWRAGTADDYLRGGQSSVWAMLPEGFVSTEMELELELGGSPFLARLSKHGQSMSSSFRLKVFFSCGFSLSFGFVLFKYSVVKVLGGEI